MNEAYAVLNIIAISYNLGKQKSATIPLLVWQPSSDPAFKEDCITWPNRLHVAEPFLGIILLGNIIGVRRTTAMICALKYFVLICLILYTPFTCNHRVLGCGHKIKDWQTTTGFSIQILIETQFNSKWLLNVNQSEL